MPGYVNCLVPQSIDRELTYLVEEGSLPGRGCRVTVPLKKGRAVALVTGAADNPPPGVEPRPILEILDTEPYFDEPALRFLKWVGDYYLAPAGMVLRAALPEAMRRVPRRRRRPPAREEALTCDKPPALTEAQQKCVAEIEESLRARRFDTFLLHGVTASGKTEVYLNAARAALLEGLSTIVLVPEIALSIQIVERFTARFKDAVVVMHSRLTGAERARAAEEARKGPRIVVGARSAVFAPVPRLGLVVVDEEHETAYKQEESMPFYHARDCAIMRGKFSSCPVVLGSATPSLESAAQAKAGRMRLLSLPERIDSVPLPKVELVSMLEEPYGRALSARLSQALCETVRKGEQALLFLNRRGFAPVMFCTACGNPRKCVHCSTNMVLHSPENSLKCHWCGYRAPAAKTCPSCGAAAARPLGIGTQKVEEEVRQLLPDCQLVRVDLDTTRKRLAHRELLKRFESGDILIGTQMIAKGLDFPRLTLVGVVLADISLSFPDFRAAERTFQLITQVAGRAGRRNTQGDVIIQSFSVEHPTILAAAAQDYWAHFETESAQRKALRYPPFGKLVRIRFVGADQRQVSSFAARAAKIVKEDSGTGRVTILGPAPASPARVAGKFRWHLFLKGERTEDLRAAASLAMNIALGPEKPSGVRLDVDVDPLNVMS